MRISIVIPSFNGEKFIANAVQSALAQKFYDPGTGMQELFEVIVRDDGSTDDTLEALKGIAAQDARLRIVADTNAGGIGYSFQKAFELATSDYVVMLGQDDTLDDNYVEQVLEAFRTSNSNAGDVVMVGCQPRFIDSDGKPFANLADPRLKIPKARNMTRAEWQNLFRIGNIYFGINTYLRIAVIEAGGFDGKAGWLLDWDLYTRLTKAHDIFVIEKEICSLGLRNDTTSNITLDKIPLQHKYVRYIREKNYKPTKRRVALATPFYMSQGFSVHAQSVIATTLMLTQAGIDWELIWLNGDSYVDRVKNTIAANFLESECTDLIMIDSDEQFSPIAISRLLQHEEEIVAAAYPFKNNWDQFAGNPLTEIKDGVMTYTGYRTLSDGSFLLQAYNVSGGFLRIKRSALEKYADAYPDDCYTDDCASPDRPGRIYTQFFACDIMNHQRYGEDAYFGRRMKEIGIKLWIDTNIWITHYGIKGWTGNFHEHLQKLAKANPLTAEQIAKITGTTAATTSTEGGAATSSAVES
jgi:glycosyltransferase involved in cell wall biosynthesis